MQKVLGRAEARLRGGIGTAFDGAPETLPAVGRQHGGMEHEARPIAPSVGARRNLAAAAETAQEGPLGLNLAPC